MQHTAQAYNPSDAVYEDSLSQAYDYSMAPLMESAQKVRPFYDDKEILSQSLVPNTLQYMV